MVRAVLIAGFLASPCWADTFDQEQETYVTSNTIGTFYHELAHALIDLYDIPIHIKEEDAADQFSVLLVDYGFQDDAGEAIAYDIAYTFSVDADTSKHFFWQRHSSDAKRAENTICMFAGGDIDGRVHMAQDWGLSERKLDQCGDERALADAFWSPFLDQMSAEDKSTEYLAYSTKDLGTSPAVKAYEAAMRAEVEALNKWLVLPQNLSVRVEPCGEANAFYDPQEVAIVMCTEFAEHYASQLKD